MGWTENEIPAQAGRTALVTGANSGLGINIARALAQHGAHVLLAARDEKRGAVALQRVQAAAPGAHVELVKLDLADLGSVRAAVTDVRGRVDSLDLLVNNAGVMAIEQRETADGFEMQLGTNHLGHFALTGLLMPLLLGSPAARVVSTSSSAHRMGSMHFDDLMLRQGYGRWKAYGQSKLANLLFTFELQRRLVAAHAPVLATAGHPGYAATNLQAGPAQGLPPGLSQVVQLVMTGVNKVVAQSDAAGALPLLYAATAPDVTGGDYFGPSGPGEAWGAPVRVGTTAAARDEAAQARLWKASEDLTGITYDLRTAAV